MTDSAGLPPALARDIAAANAGRFEDHEGPEPWQKPEPDPTRLDYARRRLRETPGPDRMAVAFGLVCAYVEMPDPDAIAGVRAVVQAQSEIGAEVEREWRAHRSTPSSGGGLGHE